ncbi:hypothetical protein BH09PSE4_BH09PSE4_15770 [soil metagenome]
MPTFPGFNSNFQIEKYPKDIQSALRRIADDFYVTRSFEPVNVGNSQYFAALARPTDETSIFLNTERELLVLFSRYDTFEIRTFEAFSIFYELVGSARVDESIRFLVSADDRIEKTIAHYLQQHPEYPIVVPLTFDSLQKSINPLIRSVQKNYLVRDLFGFQSPLKEEHFFFGRNEIVNEVIDFAKSGQNSSLFGLRKSGKTSTIFAIQRKSRFSQLNVIVVDCQDVAVHGREYEELLIWIVNKIRSDLNLKNIKGPDDISGPVVSEWFASSMKMTMDAIKSNILLIFDEIENISPNTAASPHWRAGAGAVYFWQIIRSFSQARTKNRLSICFVGTSPYLLETAKVEGIDNPAYLIAAKRFIPNLTFDETREMVGRLGFFMGLNFSPQAVARLHASYGGHPFFTRQVCSKIHQLTGIARPVEVPLTRLDDAQMQFSSQLETYLGDIISNLRQSYPEEFRLLRLLVIGDRGEIDEYFCEAPELVDHLLGYGLISARDGVFEIAFDAVRSAVLKLEPEIEEKDRNDRWSEICVRRNNVEQGARSAIFLWTRTLDAETWEAILGNAMSVSRLDNLSSREPSILLSKSNSPLYFTDLLGMLKDERILSYLDDNRSAILSAFNVTNSLRSDAHAKDFSDEDFARAVIALEILEQEFLLP